MINSADKEIDGARYECNSLPARRGMRVWTKLLRLVGPSVGIVTDGASSLTEMLKGGFKDGVISKAVDALVMRIDEDAVQALVLEMLDGMIRYGKDEAGKDMQYPVSDPKIFDLVYSANYGELVKAVLFSMEVNLPSFFASGRIGGILSQALKMADTMISKSELENASTPS